MNFLERGLLILCLLFGMAPRIAAQMPVGYGYPKINDSVVWGEDGEWIHIPALHGRNPTLVSADGHQNRLPSPPGGKLNFMSLRNQSVWMVGGDEGQGQDHVYSLYRWDLALSPGKWEKVGEIGPSQSLGPPAMLIPLDAPGRYLGLNWVFGFAGKEKASYAALFRESNGRIQFDTFVDMPFGKNKDICQSKTLPPLPARVGQYTDTPPERYACEARFPALIPTYWAPAQFKDHVVLGATQAGVLWVFSLSNGQCTKVIDLGGMDGKLEKLGFLHHFLLAMQPTQSGQLLVATCDPAVLHLAEGFYLPPESSQDAKDEARKAFLHAVEDFRAPVWQSLNPSDSWKATRTDSPLGLPQDAFDNFNLQRFQFIITPHDKVISNLDGSSWEGILDSKTLGPPKTKPAPSDDKQPAGSNTASPPTEGDSKNAPKALAPKAAEPKRPS
jgi:hypothetical protein